MNSNYLSQSEKYKPANVKTLLIAEAPHASGKIFFYVPHAMSDKRPVRQDTSLEATIFHHYFKKRPSSEEEYIDFLKQLKKMGVFLIKIYDDPIKVCESSDGLKVIIDAIPKLRQKIKKRGIKVTDRNIIFIMSRQDYKKQLKQEFPDARFINKVDFRMSHD